MQKSNLSTILWKDFLEIFKISKYQLIFVSALIGVLLFLLNSFLGVSLYTNNFSDWLKDRLWMYFYIKEAPGKESETYTEIMTLKDKLQAEWLEILFSSKEDALGFLEKKIPNVVENFQKYGIENPLPATLYVMFKNKDQYEDLKEIIIQHKDLILNIKDIDTDPGKSLQQQENRMLTFINFTNFIQTVSWSIIWLLSVIILTLMWFLLHSVYEKFHNDFKLKKMLGAWSQQITTGFVWLTLGIIIWSFILCTVLLLITWIIINVFIQKLFGMSLFNVIGSVSIVSMIYLMQIIIVSTIALILSYFYIYKLNKNV